jgi:HAD superfamily hydrolase (TIGR01549 family)
MSTSAKPKFKAVLFDLDGTLVEFRFKVKESRLAMIEWLHENGFDTENFSAETKTQRIFDEIKIQTEKRTKPRSFDSVKKSLSDILEKFEFESFTVAKPHPGSIRLLKRLKDEQIPSAVVTNSGRKPVDYVLSAFGFLPYLSLVVTRDEMNSMKPEPDGIVKAIHELGVGKAESVYVGDSIIDIQAAHRAGVTCIALSQGIHSGQELIKEGPEYVISHIEEVEDILFS